MIRPPVHVSVPQMYELADEVGITIFMDFPLQWEYSVCKFVRPNGDPKLTGNPQVMQRMLAEMIYAHYNHPSIFLWCLHNEPLSMFLPLPYNPENPNVFCPDQPYREENPPVFISDFTLNQVLDRAFLEPVGQGIDGSRPVHPVSGEGDTHIYDGWYGKDVSLVRNRDQHR